MTWKAPSGRKPESRARCSLPEISDKLTPKGQLPAQEELRIAPGELDDLASNGTNDQCDWAVHAPGPAAASRSPLMSSFCDL